MHSIGQSAYVHHQGPMGMENWRSFLSSAAALRKGDRDVHNVRDVGCGRPCEVLVGVVHELPAEGHVEAERGDVARDGGVEHGDVVLVLPLHDDVLGQLARERGVVRDVKDAEAPHALDVAGDGAAEPVVLQLQDAEVGQGAKVGGEGVGDEVAAELQRVQRHEAPEVGGQGGEAVAARAQDPQREAALPEVLGQRGELVAGDLDLLQPRGSRQGGQGAAQPVRLGVGVAVVVPRGRGEVQPQQRREAAQGRRQLALEAVVGELQGDDEPVLVAGHAVPGVPAGVRVPGPVVARAPPAPPRGAVEVQERALLRRPPRGGGPRARAGHGALAAVWELGLVRVVAGRLEGDALSLCAMPRSIRVKESLVIGDTPRSGCQVGLDCRQQEQGMCPMCKQAFATPNTRAGTPSCR
mmetsp:Transcript_83572/g.245010  ORF Transcript_83572/g.245010 Transcript_83572/m.245010 type:complete len:410 (-) Transcript_83572:164-1393(-)